MKKIALFAVLLLLVTSGSVFAAFESPDDSGSLTIGSTGSTTVKLSKNVKLEYGAHATGLGYVVGTYHTSGTKTYASSSGDSKIWSQDGTGVSTPSTVPEGTASADFSGWTPL